MPQSYSSVTESGTAPVRTAFTPPNGVPRAGAPPRPTHGVGAEPTESVPDAMNLREVFATLRRQIWLVLGVTALATAGATYSASRVRPQFRAEASVRLADPRRAMTSNIVDEAQPTSGSNEDRRVSKIQVLTSRTLVRTAVDRDPAHFRLRLDGAPIEILHDVTVAPDAGSDSVVLVFDPHTVTARGEQGSATAAYGSRLDVAGTGFVVRSRPLARRAVLHVASQDDAVSRVLAGLRARQRDQADVIDISDVDVDPRFAQQAVNGLVQTFASGDVQDAQETSKRRRVFIEQQQQHNDSLLAGADRALAAFRAREGTFSAKDKFSNEQQGLAGFGTQREALVTERASYETLRAAVTRARAAAGPERERLLAAVPATASNPVIAQLYTQLTTYQTRRDSLTTGPWAHAATHPDVQQLDTFITASQAKLVEATGAQITALDERIARLDQLASRNAVTMQRLPAVESEELRLSNEVESLRKLGEQLREEYQKARMSEAVQVGQVEVLDLATLPVVPLGSGPAPRIVLGLVVGLALGAGAALLLERMRSTITRRAELQSVLQLPALAVVPSNTRGRHPRRGPLARLRGDVRGTGLPALDHAAAEAYITLRTNLVFSNVGAPRTIVVTSSAPGDGKTTIGINLARAYAGQGARVLLIDCDLRRSRLHQLFAVAVQPGLTDMLSDRATWGGAVARTQVPNLDLLVAGTPPHNPSELLGSPAMAELLHVARTTYDVVVLDTPPALAVADAAILATKADGVVFVVRAGATDRDGARAAVEQLSAVGARIIGAVLNDPDDLAAGYPGYYDYAEYYTQTPGVAA